MHPRREILLALQQQLKDSKEFGAVWIQRALPARPVYPCVTLFTESENVEHLQIHDTPRDQDRDMIVSVIVWIRGTPDDERTEERMDKLALVVEQTLIEPIVDRVKDFLILSTEFQLDEQEPDIHAVILTYGVNYITTEHLTDE